jgi:hypothetical protein
MAREFSKSTTHKPSQEEIARRAYEIFVERGRPEGRDLDHWLEAESQLTTITQQRTPAGGSRSSRSGIRLQAQKPF